MTFSHELLETFAEEAETIDAMSGDRRAALSACLEKLPARDRELIHRRYMAGATVEQMAADVSRPLSSIYRSLERIRVSLLTCIQRAS